MSGLDINGLQGGMLDRVRLLGEARQRPERAPEGEGAGEGADFAGALARAVGGVDELQHEVAHKYEALAKGEPVELHDLMAAVGKSEVAFNLLLEVRNKLVDAWDKLSRSVT